MSYPSDAGLGAVQQVLQHRLGLRPDVLTFLGQRLAPRLTELHLGLVEYAAVLADSEQELRVAAELITPAETYFYRESAQLQAFLETVPPQFLLGEASEEGEVPPLRVWCVGCSTGEEVYTVAMLLLGSPFLRGRQLQIVGTDVAVARLETARAGIYQGGAFRVLPAEAEEFFESAGNGRRVRAEIRQVCRFAAVNILEQEQTATLPQMDVVLFRNVLLYFHDSARETALHNLRRQLRPGGFLLLGHSESLLHRRDIFEPIVSSRQLFYRNLTSG